MPPRELPGFWYDESRNRYFPLSTRPRTPPSQPPPVVRRDASPLRPSTSHDTFVKRHTQRTGAPSPRKKSRSESTKSRERTHMNTVLNEPLKQNDVRRRSVMPPRIERTGPEWRRRLATFDNAQFERSTLTRLEALDIEASLGINTTALAVSSSNPEVQMVGDQQGFLHLRTPLSSGADEERSVSPWKRHLGLMSNIVSADIIGRSFYAASFGPYPKVVYGNLPNDDNVDDMDNTESTVLLQPSVSEHREIWCASFNERGFATGTSKGLWLVPDIEYYGTSHRSVHTRSDTLAISRDNENQLYFGARSGTVSSLDLRLPIPQKLKARDDDNGATLIRLKTPVTNILRLREWELIVGLMDGQLASYDLRALRRSSLLKTDTSSQPLVLFSNRFSTTSYNLPITLTPRSSILLAAGQDRRIRAWSTTDGEQLLPDPPPHLYTSEGHSATFLERQFARQIGGLAIDEDEKRVWVANGSMVEQFDIGWRPAAL